MRRIFPIGAIAATAFLVGCVTAVGTAYGPVNASGYGYSETRIESTRYRVVFRGDGATPPGTVESFALRRAAELTLQADRDWFRVVSSDLRGEERGGVNVGAGFGTGSYGRRGGVSVGVGGDLGKVGGRQLYTARLEIIIGEGEKPDEPSVYDAASVFAATGEGMPADGARLRPTDGSPTFDDDAIESYEPSDAETPMADENTES